MVGLSGPFGNKRIREKLQKLHAVLVGKTQAGPDTWSAAQARPFLKDCRRMSGTQVDELAQLYVGGQSVNTLACSFGVNRTTVMSQLKKREIPRRPAVRKMTDEDVAEAAGHYRDGESLVTVAARFEVSARTIEREFAQAGVQTRPRRGPVA